MFEKFTDGNVEYYFERRRYGTGASSRFFTWLLYRAAGTKEWQTYGDPWQKVRLNKQELAEALANIKAKLEANK